MISRFFLSVPFRREIKPAKMDALLTMLGNIIAGLERDELRKIAYPTPNRYKRDIFPGHSLTTYKMLLKSYF